MTDDIKPEVIKKTQESLGRYIKKPPLTEKLLKKPPFRFLHDVITNVIRETGFLDGIFTPEELNHENIKDRDGKISFLQKAIDTVKSVTGIQLTARPSKIVAGHEPTKTNEFLQAIGKALEKKLDSSEYIGKTLKQQDKNGKTKSTSKEDVNKGKPKVNNQIKSYQKDRNKSRESTKKKSGISNPKTTKTSKENEQGKSLEVETPVISDTSNDDKASKTEDKNRVTVSPDLPPVPSVESEPILSKSDQNSPKITQSNPVKHDVNKLDDKESNEDIQNDATLDQNSSSPKKKEIASPHERKKKSSKINDSQVEVSKDTQVANTERKETATPVEIGIFGSKTMGSDIQETPNTQRITSARPRTARPASARPAAPRIRDRGEVVVQEEPRLAVGKVHVITDGDSVKEQDEFEDFVVEETPLVASLEQATPVSSVSSVPGEQGQHGHLVAQILETQKELEVDSVFPSGSKEKQTKRVEIEWETGQTREKEIASKEVDCLRASIQTLTRAANPLGKLMDFLQEDVDAMQRELEMWKTTNDQLQLQLLQEQSLTEESVEPMKVHLQQLQTGISAKLDEISALKATILRNDVRIQKLVTGGFVQKPHVFI